MPSDGLFAVFVLILCHCEGSIWKFSRFCNLMCVLSYLQLNSKTWKREYDSC